MKNVLILSAGRRVELVQSFQVELGKIVPNARVLAADAQPELSAACQSASDAFALPHCDNADYEEALLLACQRRDVGLVVPTIDTELPMLARARERFRTAGIELLVSDPTLIAATGDKRLTSALFADLGISTPALLQRESLAFPCFVKPYDGSAGAGARLIRDADELSPADVRNENLLFMEYVGRDYVEYTVDCYYRRDGRLLSLVPRQRLEVRAGEVSKGITRRNTVYDMLLPRLGRLAGARGCITVQVFHNPTSGQLLGIEVNPRFGGGYPLSYAAGANYPGWAISEYLLGTTPAFEENWEPDLLMLRYDAKVLVKARSSEE